MSIPQLAKWIRSHKGAYVVEHLVYVRVGIWWDNPTTGEQGVEWSSVENLTQARRVLEAGHVASGGR